MSTPYGPPPYQPNQPPQRGQPYRPPPQPYAPPPGAPQRYGPPPAAPQYGQLPAPQQPYPGAQPYGQQYGQPSEGIAVTTRFFPLAWHFFFSKPKIFVDGYETPRAGWGRTVLPARPGQHPVYVHVPWWLKRRLGPADAVVDVQPGRLVELEYKAPLAFYMEGSLGSPPQSYNGVGIIVAVYLILLLIFVLFQLVLVR